MEETITMTEILARMVRRWKKVCAAAMVTAVLLGAYQAYRMVKQAKSPENSPEAIEERYQSAIKNYEVQKENLTKSLENQKKTLEAKKEYAENSLLMAVDPYDVYTTSIVFAVTNIGGDGAVQGASQYQQTGADYLVQTIRSQYTVLYNSMDLPKDLGAARYKETEYKYLSEVLSLQSLDGGLCSIKAVGGTALESETLANAVYQYFLDHQSVIAHSSYPHSLSVVSETTKDQVDDALAAKHETLDTEIKSIQDTIEQLDAQLNDLKEPQKEEGFSTDTIIKSVVKYAALGIVLGAVFACFWICCVSVFGSRVSSTYQLERLAELPFLGSLKTPRNVLDRFANHIVGERAWSDKTQADAYLMEQIKARCPNGEKLLVLSTLSAKKAEAAASELSELLTTSGYAVKMILDAAHNPDTVQAIRQSGTILLAESVDATQMGAVQDAAVQVRSAEKQFLGFIMF